MSDDTWSAEEAMSKLADALKDKGMSIADMFAAFDADSDGSINGPELHHGIRDMVGDILSPAQISVIIQSLDVDEDHRIGLDELRKALSEEE
jgi:Ca2+-binding EF-hand superfamily protein